MGRRYRKPDSRLTDQCIYIGAASAGLASGLMVLLALGVL